MAGSSDTLDRLVANTPTRWEDGSQTRFIAFVLFFLAFLAVFVLGFLVWFVAYPESRKQLLSQIDSTLQPGPSEQERRENAFLFADPEPASASTSGRSK